jgi:hypothetical protein
MKRKNFCKAVIITFFSLVIFQKGWATVNDLKFLDQYSGQTVEELISLEKSYRIDSLVLAFESALDQKANRKGMTHLSETEQIILAVEALEREVNNGGYHQFFINSSKSYAPIVVNALNKISCPKTAEISQQAIDKLGITGPLTVSAIDKVMNKDSDDKLIEILSKFDELYYDSGEPIASQLFEYIKLHKNQISFQ